MKTMARLSTLLACGAVVFAPISAALAETPAETTAVLAAGSGETVSLFLAIAKVIGSLVVVVGLMIAAVMLLKRLGLARAGLSGHGLIEVIESRMIAPKKYVALVKIAGEVVALGVTDQAISLLTTVDGAAVAASLAQQQPVAGLPRPPSFAVLLAKANAVFGRTGKGGGEVGS